VPTHLPGFAEHLLVQCYQLVQGLLTHRISGCHLGLSGGACEARGSDERGKDIGDTGVFARLLLLFDKLLNCGTHPVRAEQAKGGCRDAFDMHEPREEMQHGKSVILCRGGGHCPPPSPAVDDGDAEAFKGA